MREQLHALPESRQLRLFTCGLVDLLQQFPFEMRVREQLRYVGEEGTLLSLGVFAA